MIGGMERLLRLRDGILALVRPVEGEPVALDEAAGRWLLEPVHAAVASPPSDCSAMDGYAVRSEEVRGPARLALRTTVFAGDALVAPLGPGQADRVLTGAVVPAGADAVVREEAVRVEGGEVVFSAPARPGENVRRAGEDVPAGGLALPAGVRLGARQRALLRAVGVELVRVHRRPRVRVVSTGDEVVSGRLPDSNGLAVASLCEALGAEVSRARAPDRMEEVRHAISAARDAAELVVTIGGASVGPRDLVPQALADLGADVRVHGVPMKPGKPFLFALLGGTPVAGLPGSPSACLAAFEAFVRPALLTISGAARTLRTELAVRLAEPVSGRPGRARLLWAGLEPGGRARPLGRDAAQIAGPAMADALLAIPAGAGDLAEGAEVTAWLLDGD
jgi:molybdopterin molybdotransferase